MAQVLPGTCFSLSVFLEQSHTLTRIALGRVQMPPKAGKGRRVAGKAARGGRYGEVILNRQEKLATGLIVRCGKILSSYLIKTYRKPKMALTNQLTNKTEIQPIIWECKDCGY